MFVLVYVDDIIITGSVPSEIDEFVAKLHAEFSLKDIGDLHFFLGVEVTHLSTRSLHLCQRKYILNLLDRWHMANAKCVNTPMVSSLCLSKDVGSSVRDPSEYRNIVGLQYVVLTRPDIA